MFLRLPTMEKIQDQKMCFVSTVQNLRLPSLICKWTPTVDSWIVKNKNIWEMNAWMKAGALHDTHDVL